MDLAPRLVEVGEVVQDRVAEDEVERPSANGSASASATRAVTSRSSAVALAASASTMPCEMSVHVASLMTPACSRFSEK